MKLDRPDEGIPSEPRGMRTLYVCPDCGSQWISANSARLCCSLEYDRAYD